MSQLYPSWVFAQRTLSQHSIAFEKYFSAIVSLLWPLVAWVTQQSLNMQVMRRLTGSDFIPMSDSSANIRSPGST